MVDYKDVPLDRTFAALADPTRRALVSALAERSQTVSELARPFPMSLQAVIKHLDVLVAAGMITRTKTGRTVACTLEAPPIDQAAAWLERRQQMWSERLDRFEAYLHRVERGELDGTQD
jgi:DNA-binding transcriptional ArsR family regulator